MSRQNNHFKSSLHFPSKALAHLFSRVETQNQLLRKIQKVLPQPLASHARHCIIKHKKLVLYTDAAVWASQLRFYNNVILKEIAPFTAETIDILQIRIFTENAEAKTAIESKVNIPSEVTINNIHQQALTTADSALSAALLRLSKTLQNLS